MAKFKSLMASACAVAISVLAPAASAQMWEDVAPVVQSKTSVSSEDLSWARKVSTNLESLKLILDQAPNERFGSSDIYISLPLPDGGAAKFSLTESPILAPGLSATNPNIRTFHVTDVANSTNIGRLDLTSRGFHGMFMHKGERVFIDPAVTAGSYHTYYENDYAVKEGADTEDGLTCTQEGHSHHAPHFSLGQKTTASPNAQKISFGTDLRRYRMAVAATGEYTNYFGGTKEDALGGIVTAINRLNVIFESEMAVRMEVVANNDAVIYTDADTDPFTHSDRSVLIGEINDVLDAEIGVENYDIGHVFGVFGGGIARLGAVCRSGSKGRGVSGTSRPDRSSFVTLLAHEVGHQFNAPHTFNGTLGSCETNRSGSGAVEPHSGSTIMSYAGICGRQNLAGGKTTFFHNSSLTSMSDYVDNPSRGGSCPVLTPTLNAAPVVDAGVDGAIPASTPFTLTGVVTDADGDALTHIWEQVDRGPRNETPEDFADDGQRPLFRSFQPNESPSRTFPQLPRILAGDYVMGEVLPTTDRTLTFRMTSRDGRGGVTDDERILSVTAAAGPFTIETPSTPTVPGGMPQTIAWDVANTTAAPIDCADVRLSLSTDGGATFSEELTASTPNTGSAVVTLPNIATTAARLKASCVTQPFFAINDANFTITRSIIANQAPTAVADTLTVEEDSLRTQINVLANDSDPENDTLALASVGATSSNGTVETTDSLILYTPQAGFVGTETFDYTVSDGNDNTSSATVTVTVTAKPNVAPVVMDDSITVEEGSEATLIDVLSNDSDADGDTLSFEALGTPDNGGAIAIRDDQIAYTPASTFSGTETFTYTVTDGEGASVTGTVTVTVTAAPPPPPPTPPAQSLVSNSGGGGSFGPFLLILLALREGLSRRRRGAGRA